jgi:hypothetical protein
MLGWTVMYVTPEQIDSGEAYKWIAAKLSGTFADTTPPKKSSLKTLLKKANRKKKK